MYRVAIVFFFFKQKTAYEMRISDWSSDVCSSDLAIVGLSADEAAAALGQLSGEFHASIKSAMLEDSRFVREVATARVRSAFEAAPATNMSIRAYGPDGPQSTSSDTDRFAVWAQGFGSWGSFDSEIGRAHV